MVYEKEMIIALRNIGIQLQSLQAKVMNVETAVKGLGNGSTSANVRVVPFGVVDITSAQLIDAYRRGLDMEQLIALANGKYTAEQIYKKLQRGGA